MASLVRVCYRPQSLSPLGQSVRGYVTLKDMRLKAVKNIQKITKSMKMVAASKYSRAERELKPAQTYGGGAIALLDKVDIIPEQPKPKHIMICMSSDRGLCGSIHSNIAKKVRNLIAERPPGETALVLVGDKLRGILKRTHASNILMTFNEIGRRPPTFPEASFVAGQVLESEHEFESGEIVFNKFRSVISFRTTLQPFVPLSSLVESESMSIYDDVDEEVLRCYHEITLANMVFYCLKEGACSEQSARMTAMGAASKNAGEMIDKLTLTYNRTRQAVITSELIEIISGAAAL